MRCNLSKFFVLALLLMSGSAAALDYGLLSHRVFLDSLRAGNHDDSGVDDYYFTLVVSALRNTKEEAEIDVEKRQMISRDLQKFGEIKINVLTNWKSATGKPEEEIFYAIDGDQLRQLISEAMRTFKVREDEVAVMVEVSLYEKNKRFWLFGEDTLVGKTKYFPVPASKTQAPSRTNLKLAIIDDKGTDVVLKVKYDKSLADDAKAKDAAATAAPSETK